MASDASAVRVILAPDSFKGTHTAGAVAAALAAGVRAAGCTAHELPIADGGEGTMEALLAALGGERHTAAVHDPLGRIIDAEFVLLPDGRTAIVEMAQASGLSRVAESERDAFAASTAGTGELIAAAVAAGAEHVVVTVGGAATSDGGAGALAALDAAAVAPRLSVLCDVDVPWQYAPRVFGPQKGADPAVVARLEARLDAMAERAPRDPRGVPMTGAAGGLSGGLWAFRQAELLSGAEYVLKAVSFDRVADGAALIVTGEGSLDEQTFAGKAVGAVAARSRLLSLRCDAVVGRSRLSARRSRELGLERVVEASTLDELEAAGTLLARGLRLPGEPVPAADHGCERGGVRDTNGMGT